MKKKIKDLSVKELRNICIHAGLCVDCPLFSKKITTCLESYLRIRQQLIDEDELNKEVEV